MNVSTGGACLSMPKVGKPGDRIRLTLPGNHEKPTYVVLDGLLANRHGWRLYGVASTAIQQATKSSSNLPTPKSRGAECLPRCPKLAQRL